MSDVLTFTKRGIYCAAGDFYIDPSHRVDRALVTHGHADHARPGMGAYLATASATPVLQHRLGTKATIDPIPYGESRQIGGARVSFHPAGHVPGSAQIRVDVAGEVWVASGDYKTEDDGLSEPFAPIPCHSFITECTFGLPIYAWPSQSDLVTQINDWWANNRANGRASFLGAYSLGKAQRLLATIDTGIGPVLTHHTITATNAVLRAQGFALPQTVPLTPDTRAADHPGALILAPQSSFAQPWAKAFHPAATAFASGWMAVRKTRRSRSMDRGFVVSDHADWDGLNTAIRATGAEKIFVMHGFTAPFQRWLASQGYDARIVP